MAAPLIEIKFDEAKLLKVQQMLRDIPRKFPYVIKMGINRTASSAKVAIARQISAEVSIDGIKLGVTYIKKNITKKLATNRVWQAILGFKSTGWRRIEQTAFKATMPSGHKGIFRRKGKKRLHILQGPSLGEILEEKTGLIQKAVRDASQKLERNINDQVALALKKWGMTR